MASQATAPESVVPRVADHVAITPGVCGSKPRIAGTRIKVKHIVRWHDGLGLSPDEIVSKWPHLTLGDVYAALAYYHDHRDEIRAEMLEEVALAEALEAQQPSLNEKLRARIHAPDDPVP